MILSINSHRKCPCDFLENTFSVGLPLCRQSSSLRSNICCVQNYLTYRIAASKMSDFTLSSSTVVNVKSLSTSKSVEMVKSGVCERVLRKFALDYIPSASGNLAPVQLIEEDLLDLMKRSSTVMVTYDGDDGREITSLSFAESMLLKTRLRNGEVKLAVQYFGTSFDDLVDDIRAHLSHNVVITLGRNVFVWFHFPTCIDREAASATISKNVAHGIKSPENLPIAHLSSFK